MAPSRGDVPDEVDRLGALGGPSEPSDAEITAELTADVEHSQAVAREAVQEAGRLRGELAEMRVQLARARQDQDTFQRRRRLDAGPYLVDLAGEAWSEVVRPAVARTARRLGLRR